MVPMWLLALILMLQVPQLQSPCLVAADLSNCKSAVASSFRLNGRIVVDKGELPLVDVRLKDDRGSVLRTVQSFANGSFFFDGVGLGRYSVEVADARFEMATVPLWLRDPEDSSGMIVIRLKPNTGTKQPGPGITDLDKIIRDLKLDVKVPAAALDEFVKGAEAISQRSKNDSAESHFRPAIAI